MPRKNPLLGINLDPTAETRAKEHIDHFSEALVTEAKSIAFRERDNIVLPGHVDHALERLEEHQKDAWKPEVGKVVGGVMLGAFIPGFFTEIEQGAKMHTSFLVFYTCIGLLGIVAVSLSFREW